MRTLKDLFWDFPRENPIAFTMFLIVLLLILAQIPIVIFFGD